MILTPRHLSFLLAGALLNTPPTALPQQPPAPVIRSDSTEVLVDVIVRDKRGHLLRGLKADDLVVQEDGVQQKVTSFKEVKTAGEASAPPAPQAAANPQQATARQEIVQAPKQVRLVSLVYDRLSLEGRRLGRQASLDFLKKDQGDNVYYAVFSIDRGFRVLQPYTNDQDRLRRAVERATSGDRSNFDTDNQGLDTAISSTTGSAGAAAAAGATASAGGAVDGGAMSAEQSAAFVQAMSDFTEQITREELGRMSVFSLWGILKELKTMPGRKTVLYFAEGMQMPTGLVEQFKSMISDANRANVSVYAIDARGLSTTSDQALANKKLSQAAYWSTYARSTEHESAAENKQEFRTFDRAVDSLRANAQNVMMELAEETGGFLMANTNDFRPALQKLSEEMNTYYEISYRPTNQLPDGRFRAIAIKVNHKDAIVQARNGYFALPSMDGQAVFPYEVPLLRALAQSPMPRDLDFRSSVIRYRHQFGKQQCVLVFDLPMKNIAFLKDDKASKYRTHISVLSLIKDEDGRVVTKLSRDVPLNEPLDRLAGFQQGRFIATRNVNLSPGRYTVESVAADQEGHRLGARRSILVVPQSNAKMGLSEISLVRRLDKPAETRDLQDPLQLPQGKIVPTLVDTIPGGAGKMLSLYFLLYPDEANQEKPKLVLDLLKDGKVLTRSMPPLGPAEPSGAVPFVANTPLDSVTAGQYEFRASLIQGTAAVQKSIFVNVE